MSPSGDAGSGARPAAPSPPGLPIRLPPALPETPEGRKAGGRPIEDLFILGLAVLALAVPSWLGAPGAKEHASEGGAPAPLRIDANRAPWHEWILLEGIGEARAKRIVALRAERGGFRSVEDLESLPGMPRGWSEKIREFLVFDARGGNR